MIQSKYVFLKFYKTQHFKQYFSFDEFFIFKKGFTRYRRISGIGNLQIIVWQKKEKSIS